jgi:hypothetical protein
LTWAIITGFASGTIGGLDKSLAAMSWNPSYYVVKLKYSFEPLERLYKITYNSELARRTWTNAFSINGINTLLSSAASNLDMGSPFVNFLKKLWREKTGKIWSVNR